MTDIITTPARSDNGGTGVLIGGALLLLVTLLLVFYGIPALSGATNNSAPVQQAPKAESSDGGNIVFPDEVDVTVNQPQE